VSARPVRSYETGSPAAARAGTTRRPTRREWVRELALVFAGLLVYFGVRAATSDDRTLAEAHARSVVHLEQALGIAREADLQRLILGRPALVTLANWIYIWGHWPLIAVSAVWLFLALARYHARTVVRVLGTLMPVAMALAVVVTANHYVLDVIVGGIVALAGLGIASILIRTRDRRSRHARAEAFANEAPWSTSCC
jgi:hypothetical protein